MSDTGSGFPEKTSIRAEQGVLKYKRAPEGESSAKRVSPTAADWTAFWRELDAIGIWDWWPDYRPDDVGEDGYSWQVDIAIAGRMVTTRGYLSFPSGHGISTERSSDWDELISALSRLLGGLPVD